jgi:type IV pilus assembly protein PilM
MSFLNPFAVRLPLVGIDISGPVVRAVEFRRSMSGKTELVAVGEAELPPTAAEDPFANTLETSKAVKNALENPIFGKFKAKVAVASLPEYRCFVRVIHVQNGMSDGEIDQSVPFEAESYIPIPLDQVNLDWQRIKSADDRVAVLLAAAPYEVIQKGEEILTTSGLIPAGLEVESMSLVRSVLGDAGSVDALLVDIGTSRTDLVVVEQGSVQFASSIPLAEGVFVDAAVKSLGLTKTQAAALVRKAGVENTASYPNLRQVLSPAVSMLAAEIKNIISFHDQHSPRRLSKVILIGRGAALPKLDVVLQEEMKGVLAVEVGDPWKAVGAIGVPDSLVGASGVRFAAAVGLSLREAVDL